MISKLIYILYPLSMVVIIVAVDVLFLSHKFWWRLFINIAIALAFVAVYLIFIKKIYR